MSRSSIVEPLRFERSARKVTLNVGDAKAGATAGWAVRGAANTSLATLPASQTSSTLVVPVHGLKVGDVITGFYLLGQIESAANTVTVDAELRKHTSAAADVADASVASMTQISVTADTAINKSNSRKASLSEVINEDETLYVLITGTTGLSTDVALQGVVVEYTEH